MRRAAAALLVAAGLTGLQGCASEGAAGPAASRPRERSPEVQQVLDDAKEQARRLETENRLPEALLRWRAAVAVAPDDHPSIAGVARVKSALDARVASLVAKGDAARAAHDFVGARTDYEQALSLSPDLPAAIAGLKAVETDATLQSIASGTAGGPGMEGAGSGGGKTKARPKRARKR